MTDLSRRAFLHSAAAGAGALSLAVIAGASLTACGGDISRRTRIAHADATGELLASIYITVRPDGRIALTVNKAELGQGVATGYATLVAEELSAPLDHVEVGFAGSNSDMRTSTRMQITGGSTSTVEAFGYLRRAAAAAREMLIHAAAEDWHVAPASCTVKDGRVVHAATGRSAGYGELTARAAHLPVPDDPPLKPRRDYTLIGNVNRRIDATAKTTGAAKFGIDVDVPGMVNAYVIHGPVYGARPVRVTEGDARARPGVIAVLALPFGVAVVAAKFWQARAAAQAIEVTWTAGDVATLTTEHLQAAMRDYRGPTGDVRHDGHAHAAIERAASTAEAVYEAPYVAHATLEPQNATAHVTGDRCEIWAPTQSPTIVQGMVGDALGIAMDNVTVHVTLCGGGFGRRAIGDVSAQAALISQRVGKPVKLTWTRESDLTQGFYRPVYAIAARGGSHADGACAGAAITCVSQSIARGELLSPVLAGIPGPVQKMFVDALLALFTSDSAPDLFATEGLKNTPYDFGGNFSLVAAPVETRLPVTSWRSVGNSVTGFAMESFVDELAHAAKLEPTAYRRRLLPPRSKARRALDAVTALAGWATPAPPGRARGVARHYSFDTEVAEVAEVELVADRIKVRRVWCVVDCGLALNPDIVKAQMESAIIFGLSAALDQEITLVDGVVQQTNYDTFPLLRMFEAPEITVQIMPSDADPTGVGEPGLPPIAAAVANAIFTLTGVRLRRLPLQRAWNEHRGHAR